MGSFSLLAFSQKPQQPQKPQSSFCCTMEVKKPSFIVGEPVNFHFSIRNLTDRTLYVLTWYTPLEGLYGDIFRVIRDGRQEIPYRGIMAKRGQPTAEDYVFLGPGNAISREVDLATSYDLSKTGYYHVEFKKQLADITTNKQTIPRKQDAHQAHKILCNAVDFQIINKPQIIDD